MPGFVNGVRSVPKRNLIRGLGVRLRLKKRKNFVTDHSNVLTLEKLITKSARSLHT